jgi:hypothetical protein
MPINIHGKSYNTVAERITSAGKELLSVETEVLYIDPVVIKATIVTSKGKFTGISAANPSKSLEKESPYEVAETSAVGRALAFAGYETTNGIASAEEMAKVASPTPSGQTINGLPVIPKFPSVDYGKCPRCGSPNKWSVNKNKAYCGAMCWNNPKQEMPTKVVDEVTDEVMDQISEMPF